MKVKTTSKVLKIDIRTRYTAKKKKNETLVFEVNSEDYMSVIRLVILDFYHQNGLL